MLLAHQHRPTACPYPEVVEEAICFGWVDSTNTILDEERGLQLITPRRPKSPWTGSTAHAQRTWKPAAS